MEPSGAQNLAEPFLARDQELADSGAGRRTGFAWRLALASAALAGACGGARLVVDTRRAELLRVSRMAEDARAVDRECRDYPRYDGQPYTEAEDYSCETICETGWCTSNSYRTQREGQAAPIYEDGVLGTYYVVSAMKKSPFHYSVVDRLAVEDPTGHSAHEAALTGTHWYPWDTEMALTVLKNAGITRKQFGVSLWKYLKSFTTRDRMPGRRYIRACQRAEKLLGRRAWLQNEANVRCEDVPDVVKTAEQNALTRHGRAVRRLWENTCRGNEDAAKKYSFVCYTGGSQAMLWDANYNAASYGQKVTPRFNLPWDVACCCCGGGTARNKPGEQMRFRPDRAYEGIAAKLTPPASDADWGSFVDGKKLPLLDTGKHPSWMSVLYPSFTPDLVGTDLLYTFPSTTYQPAATPPYPFASGMGNECEDYELEKDILDFTIQYEALPSSWTGWAGYTCRFYYYNKGCDINGVQSDASVNQFGPMEQYYNGMLKESVVDSWVFPAPPLASRKGQQRADAFKVCCACGGGRKKSGASPKTILDPLADEYYVKTR